MARKKSRKIGKIGVAKSDQTTSHKSPNANERVKKKKGNTSGSRQQQVATSTKSTKKQKVDPRLGSTKSVDLSKYRNKPSPVEPAKPTYSELQLEQFANELAQIENDPTLDALLEKQISEPLLDSEQAVVDKLTQRYAELCEILGISEDDGVNVAGEDLDDPLASIDSLSIKDFED